MTKVMKENLKSEKINAFNEAKEMLSSVKKYYSEKISLIKTKSKTKEFESMKFSSDEDSDIIDQSEVLSHEEQTKIFRQKT